MKAGELLVAADGAAPSAASAASGLLALTNLGHADLAVALLVDLWDEHRNRISTEAAMLVIDAALASRADPNARLVAADLLCRNAERLDPRQSLHWPSVIDGGWDPTFGPKTKLLLFDALVRVALSHEPTDTALRAIVVRLYGAWRNDPDEHVRGCVGSLIAALLPELKQLRYQDFLEGNVRITMADVEKAAASGWISDDHYLARIVQERQQHLIEWARRRSEPPEHNVHLAFGGVDADCILHPVSHSHNQRSRA